MSDIITISVSMPAEMQRLIMEQIKARFFGNISEYFRHLVREDLEAQSAARAQQAPEQPIEQSPTRRAGFRESISESAAAARAAASRTPTPTEISDAEVEQLRRRYPLQTIEKIHAKAAPGSAEAKRLARMLKVLRGEGTPKERFVWWDYMDLEFFDMLRFRYNIGEDPEELGGSTVKAPKAPKPGSGSARAKPPRDQDR